MTKLALALALVLATLLAVGIALRVPLLAALPLGAALVLFLGRGARPRDVENFIGRTGIGTTSASRQLIAEHLSTGRQLRAVLLGAGFVAPLALTAVLGRTAPLSWSMVLGAYALGTLATELSITRPSTETRVASLVPREPAAYLGRWLRWGPTVAGALALVVWLGAVRLHDTVAAEAPSRATIAAGALLGVALPLLTMGAQRLILARPQPLVDPHMVAADDALRAAAVQNLTAVVSCIVLIDLAGGLYQHLLLDHDTPFRWLFGLGLVASIVLALASWSARDLSQPVRRRPFALPPTTAPTPQRPPTDAATTGGA